MEPTLWDTLAQLFHVLWTLLVLLVALAWNWIFLILWVAWWLWGVNWRKLWPVLARGGWAPLVLLTVLTALVWSRFSPAPLVLLDLFVVPNFWWQLLAMGLLVGLALFSGWLQGVFDWAPTELSLEPPHGSPGHGHENVHAPGLHH